MVAPGKLYIVSTPIGNLGDITPRAAETLEQVERVAAEDTRRTRELLSHLGIRGNKLIAVDAHASEKVLERLVDDILGGVSVACVTDAGTPSVSDPGNALVRRAAERGVEVLAIPGASAVTAAVAVSGLVEGPFLFLGFLPRRGKKRRTLLERMAHSEEPVVLFESPHRTRATLEDMAELFPDRIAVVCREITKVYEESIRGTVSELVDKCESVRGEVTIVVGPSESLSEDLDDEAVDLEIARQMEQGVSARDIAAELAERTGRPKRVFYNRVQTLRSGGD